MLERINKSLSRHLPSLYLRVKRVYRNIFGSSSEDRHLRIPADMSVEAFFQVLKQTSVSYVVLRWSEQLPDIDPGKSIELLVSDADTEKVRGWLTESSDGVACDLFSVSGLPGLSYKNMPLFPPGLSENILSSAQTMDGLYRIPSSAHRFLILAYHSVYHDGYCSGIPSGYSTSESDRNKKRKSHSYLTAGEAAEMLEAQVGQLNPAPEFTLEGLDAYLAERGWQPPMDMLSRYVKSNAWLYDHFFANLPAIPAAEKGLACFIFRDKASHKNILKLFLPDLANEGFEILKVLQLEDNAKTAAQKHIRGGNWGMGSWPVSGGGPNVMAIVRDRNPEPVPDYLAFKYPLLDNYRLYKAKTRIRNRFNDKLPDSHHCSVVHVTDNAREAWEYINIAVPGLKPGIKELIYMNSTEKQEKRAERLIYRSSDYCHRTNFVRQNHLAPGNSFR